MPFFFKIKIWIGFPACWNKEWMIKLKVNQSWHIWAKGWIEFWVNLTQSPRLNCHLPRDSACFLFACLNRIDFIPPNRRGWSGSFVGRRAIVIQWGWYNHVLSLSQTQTAICVIIVTIGLGDLLMFFVSFFFLCLLSRRSPPSAGAPLCCFLVT